MWDASPEFVAVRAAKGKGSPCSAPFIRRVEKLSHRKLARSLVFIPLSAALTEAGEGERRADVSNVFAAHAVSFCGFSSTHWPTDWGLK